MGENDTLRLGGWLHGGVACVQYKLCSMIWRAAVDMIFVLFLGYISEGAWGLVGCRTMVRDGPSLSPRCPPHRCKLRTPVLALYSTMAGHSIRVDVSYLYGFLTGLWPTYSGGGTWIPDFFIYTRPCSPMTALGENPRDRPSEGHNHAGYWEARGTNIGGHGPHLGLSPGVSPAADPDVPGA